MTAAEPFKEIDTHIELTELADNLRAKYIVLRDLEARHKDQAGQTREVTGKLAQGLIDADSVASEKAKLAILNDGVNTARSDAAELWKEYESQIRRAIVSTVLDHLHQAASDAGGLVNDLFAIKKELRITGRAEDEIAQTMLTELRLTHSSSYLIADFKKAFGLPPDIGWTRRPGATSL